MRGNNSTASASASATALHGALQCHHARDVPVEKTNGIFHINHRDSPMAGAALLIKNHILGAAVYDDDKEEYSGYFDMRDLLSSVIFNIRARMMIQQQYKLQARRQNPQYDLVKNFQPNVSLHYLAQRNPLRCIRPDTPLQKVCEYLCHPTCRRVAICDFETKTRCINIITRRSLLNYISKYVLYRLEETLDESGLEYRKPVIQVTEDTTALETFELMDSKGLYGIAIVDKNDGSLKGYTCASDIRLALADVGGNKETTSNMDMDIMSYLAKVRKLDQREHQQHHGGWKKNHHQSYPSCHANATILQIVSKLVATRYHRIFVINQKRVPIGVISLLDVLQFIMKCNSDNSKMQVGRWAFHQFKMETT